MRSYATKESDYDEPNKENAKQKIKVLCVDEGNYSYIKSGKIYEAEDYNTNYYQLMNDEGDVALYRKTCFVTYTPLTTNTFKNGDTALCIEAENSSGLTLGKIYDVVGAEGNWIEIMNDSQSKSDYMFVRFVPIDNTTSKTENIKPPLGLKPRKIYWEDLNYHRRQDIIAAMQRRVDAKMDIPVEWCKELIDLVIAGDKNE